MKNIEIVNQLREDFAAIKGLLIHLQDLRDFGTEQRLTIESALSTFCFLQSWYLCQLRLQFGEQQPDCFRLEKIDKPPAGIRYSISIHTLFAELSEKAQELQRKILNLPGENGCSDDQSKTIDELQEGLRWWRNCELPRMIGTFNKS